MFMNLPAPDEPRPKPVVVDVSLPVHLCHAEEILVEPLTMVAVGSAI
jgi:hypothetical protein